ncbi:MAG: two pore domain potassium channel family protein [Bacilli bacterium]|nr:two pore domain potassium channel family protein [Bacilli bacterium]
MAKKKLTKYQKRLAQLIANGAISTLALLFCVLSASFFLKGEMAANIFLPLACFFMGAIYFLNYFTKEKTKLSAIRNFGLVGIYSVLIVLSIIAAFSRNVLALFIFVFFLMFIFDTIIGLVMKHKARNVVLAILKFLLAILFILLFVAVYIVGDEEVLGMMFAFVPLLMAIIAFAHAMLMVFSGVRKTTIVQILKKTYSIEILYGLIVLVVATALVLTITEDNMSIGDALWYCFALVTTIGFGDVTAVTIVGRILSVILGIYGIIVVALITSIIVNFYNETKHDRDDEEDEVLKEELKELNDQRKEEVEKKADEE